MKGYCDDCPFRKTREHCLSIDGLLLDLINRQDEEINRLEAKYKELQELVNDMGDYFPACIECEGKTPLGERTDKCVYMLDNTNYCTKRGISNIVAIQKENCSLKAENERLSRITRNLVGEIKAEAYTEFAERLKKKYKPYVVLGSGVAEIEIDDLLKEMVGEDK